MMNANTDRRSPTLAIIQQPPVFLNLAASMDRAVEDIKRAADAGADIIAFAECWLPGYPVWIDEAPDAALWDHPGAKQLYRLLSENAVVQGDPHLARLSELAAETGAFIMMGTHERAAGTLYNTTFTFSPDGKAVFHRKLVPTYTERLVWGRGDGSSMDVVDMPWGRLGGLICWEHWMPLARAAMHAKEETIHVAQWPTVKDMHHVASRHYAFEGRCYVAAAGCILSHGDVMEGFASLGQEADAGAAKELLASMAEDESHLLQRGGSAIIGPDGSYAADPVYEKPAIVTARLDMNRLAEERLALDTAGHYSRPDIFELNVNTRPQMGVTFSDA